MQVVVRFKATLTIHRAALRRTAWGKFALLLLAFALGLAILKPFKRREAQAEGPRARKLDKQAGPTQVARPPTPQLFHTQRFIRNLTQVRPAKLRQGKVGAGEGEKSVEADLEGTSYFWPTHATAHCGGGRSSLPTEEYTTRFPEEKNRVY